MLQCQRREGLREGMTSFDELEIGEADLFAEVSIRRMSGYGMAAFGH